MATTNPIICCHTSISQIFLFLGTQPLISKPWLVSTAKDKPSLALFIVCSHLEPWKKVGRISLSPRFVTLQFILTFACSHLPETDPERKPCHSNGGWRDSILQRKRNRFHQGRASRLLYLEGRMRLRHQIKSRHSVATLWYVRLMPFDSNIVLSPNN